MNGRTIWSEWRLERNPSYLNSVKAGLKLGLWFLPLGLARGVLYPLGAAIVGTGLAVALFFMVIFSHYLAVIAGLFGFCTPVSKE